MDVGDVDDFSEAHVPPSLGLKCEDVVDDSETSQTLLTSTRFDTRRTELAQKNVLPRSLGSNSEDRDIMCLRNVGNIANINTG